MKTNIKKKRELRDVTITHVSFVDKGANQRTFLLAKAEGDVESNMEIDVKYIVKADLITTTDDEQRLLYGIVYEPDVVDSHGDFMTADNIEKACHEYMRYYRAMDRQHDLEAGMGEVVECYTAPCDLTLNGNAVTKGTWIIASKATQEIWDAYKKGDITGFSMYGIARNVIEKTEVETKENILERALRAIGFGKSFDDTVNERISDITKSPYFLLDMLHSDYYENLEWNEDDIEKLNVFSKSLGECKAYVDKKVVELSTIVTSEVDDETINEEEIIINNEEGDNSMEETKVLELVQKCIAEIETPDITEQVTVLLKEVLEESNAEINEVVKGLTETVATLTEKIEKFETDSSAGTETQVTEVAMSHAPTLL